MTTNPTETSTQLPAWPDTLAAPVVTLDFPLGIVETYVEIQGVKVQFWRWANQDYISNTYDHGLHFSPSDRPWLFLSDEDLSAAIEWGSAVQCRAEYALTAHGEPVVAGTPAAAAILAYATGEEPGSMSSEDASAARMDAALALWPETEDGAQSRVQDMLTDVRHYCRRHGLDLEAALADSADAFESESGSPYFTGRS